MQLWVVCQNKSWSGGESWDLGGVFSSRDKALEACTEYEDVMWPVELDEFLGRETYVNPNVYHPMTGQTLVDGEWQKVENRRVQQP